MIEPAVAKAMKRAERHPATPAAYGNAARTNGMQRETKITGAAVALEPAVRALEPRRADVELGAVALQQFAAAEVADRIGDRGAGHVADHARRR